MNEKKIGIPFERGRAKTGGRVKGSRNKLTADFITALCRAFDERGEEAIRIVIDESPKDFLKIIAMVLPKEFEISDSRLKEIPDHELDALIELVRQRLGHPRKPDGGEVTPLN